MKKNLFKILGAMAIVMCMSLCFAGCDLFGGGPKVKAIELQVEFNQTIYEVGTTSSNVSGGVIKVTYEDDTTKHIPVTDSMISNFNSSEVGTYNNMIITYQDATCLASYVITGFNPVGKGGYLYYSQISDPDYSYDYVYFYMVHDNNTTYIYSDMTNITPAVEYSTIASKLSDLTCEQTTASSWALGSDYYYYTEFYVSMEPGGSGIVKFKYTSVSDWVLTVDAEEDFYDESYTGSSTQTGDWIFNLYTPVQ